MYVSRPAVLALACAALLVGCTVKETPLPSGQPCEDPRPEICTMNYEPVCGFTAEGNSETHSNACSACSDPKVIGYQEGSCAAEQ